MFNTAEIFSTRRRLGAAVSTTVTVTVTGTSATAVFGTSPAGTTVTVSKAGTSLGTATANGAGAWSYALATAPGGGDVYTASLPIVSGSYAVIGAPALKLAGAPSFLRLAAGGRLLLANG